MNDRAVKSLFGIIAALLAVAALIKTTGLTWLGLKSAVTALPFWALLLVTGLTYLNVWVGTYRWRMATAWIEPAATLPSFREMLRQTLSGSILSQILPTHLAMPLARWGHTKSGWSVRSTIYEQLFDIIALITGIILATALYLFDTSALISILSWCVSVFLLTVGSGRLLRIASEQVPLPPRFDAVTEALSRASHAPQLMIHCLVLLSITKLVLLSLRSVLVFYFVVPGIAIIPVAIGYPLAGFAMAIPFLPAGLGLADWSWTGILSFAGAGAAIAAAGAITLRLVNIFALVLVTIMMSTLTALISSVHAEAQK